jgi:hypothetical protein
MPIYTPHERRLLRYILIGGSLLAIVLAVTAVVFVYKVWFLVVP